METLSMQKIPYIPEELVDIIADYHDYAKYCKPTHQSKFKEVMSDIINMGEIMNTISAKIAKECWGSGSQNLYSEYLWQDDSWLSIHTNHVNEWIDFPSLLEEDNYDNEDNYGMVGLYDDNDM
tara:strand:- start:144 stop:512 length:369 start_codon:yes stop_codon:yes gene_type:complete